MFSPNRGLLFPFALFRVILFSAVDTKIFNCAAVDEVSFYLLDNGELRHVSDRFLRPPFGVSTIHLSGEADVGRPDSEDGISTAEFRFKGSSACSTQPAMRVAGCLRMTSGKVKGVCEQGS